MLELLTHVSELGHDGADHVPEPRAVVHFTQVCQFVRHDIVDDALAEMDQPPMKANGAIGTGTTPTGFGRRQTNLLDRHRHLLRKVRHAVFENGRRLSLQPGLHGIADLLRCGVLRQAQMQRLMRDARQGVCTGVQMSA